MKFSSRYALFLILNLFTLSVLADEVRIIKAELESYSGKWTVRVTLKHEDKGWKHYADGWRIVDEKGTLIATRTLHHPHDKEQPFTRNLSGINIPASTSIIFIEAHDKQHGWSADRLRIDLRKNTGARYTINSAD